MNTTILSLNVSRPTKMEWDGKETTSGTLKRPVRGPLVVSKTSIEGDSFQATHVHGTPDSALYAFGMLPQRQFEKFLL